MSSPREALGVPAAFFVIAVSLALFCGPSVRALAPRAPAAATGADCMTSIKDVKATLDAKKWNPGAPGQGEISVTGSYDTTFNTKFWSGGEIVGIKMKIKVVDLIAEMNCESEAFGSVKMNDQSASKTSKDDNDVQEEKFQIGKNKQKPGGGLKLNDGADLNKAILDAAKKAAKAGGCGQQLDGVISKIDPASETALKASLKTSMNVVLGLHWGGTLHSNDAPCPKRWHGESADFKIDEKGNSKKKTDLSTLDEPDTFVPIP